ncbi:MAG: hypothetical protein WC184_13285 [Acidimicrobiia bacterium]
MLGRLLSEAVAAGLGPTLFSGGATVRQVLQALSEYQHVFGPIMVVVGWAHLTESVLEQLVEATSRESTLIVVADRDSTIPSLQGFRVVESDFLTMSDEEAVSEARGAVSDVSLVELLSESRGQFARFKSRLMKELGESAGIALRSGHWAWGDAVAVDGVLDALIDRERWADAFDLATARASERLTEFIDDAGNFYFNNGSYSYLLSRLGALPPDVKRDEKIAYWLVSAALATNRHHELGGHVEAVMQSSEAPEVRASTAVVSPTSGMLAETSRAVEMLRSPATLRAHGFALAWAGERAEPIALFREAMRQAEREGADHLVVACGVDIAEVEIRQGNYRSGAEWAEWALAEYGRRGIHESLRYKAATATNAFARLLLGEERVAEHLLQGIGDSREYIGVPGYEGITSTWGDLALLKGELEEARSLYSGIHEAAPIDVFCFTTLSLVAVHIARGDWESARRAADTAYALSRSSTPHEKALGDLILGIALSEAEPSVAEQHLLSAIENLAAEVHRAQAAAWLAIARSNQGKRKSAVQALKLGSRGIRELGESGWRLICAEHPSTELIRRLWTESEYEFELNFLGAKRVRTEKKDVVIGLRSAEILAILSIYSNGLSGERLHAYMYGDEQFPRSTLKASISRLRELVPIGSSPYRIDATYQADFLRLVELVSIGELQRALNIYGGPLLPESESPLIGEWREHVDEAIRSAVLKSCDADLLIQLGTQLDNDLEVWEAAKNCILPGDYRRPVINARIRRVRASWERETIPQ